ncbi:hypothetical protein [Spirosoma validum]|uniref:Uncharacterized protein n=1 Tax=Spirosoma validum TaxID=2771355 RepID=A0A927B952_9BACT|nr:hypothetical protein [Spirosoma validum]MBD2757422.1 hypothetical protein [Spirosoma validum]
MMTLADATDLLQQTTEQLSANTDTLTPQAGVTLIDQWIEPLTTAENTHPIADQLKQLKSLLQAPAIDKDAIQNCLSELADLTSTMGIGMGSEGEMPSLMDGLAAAIRQAGQTSRVDE